MSDKTDEDDKTKKELSPEEETKILIKIFFENDQNNLQVLRRFFEQILQWANGKYRYNKSICEDLFQKTCIKMINHDAEKPNDRKLIKSMRAIFKYNFHMIVLDYADKSIREPQNKINLKGDETLSYLMDKSLDISNEQAWMVDKNTKNYLADKNNNNWIGIYNHHCFKILSELKQNILQFLVEEDFTLHEMAENLNLSYYKVQKLHNEVTKEFSSCIRDKGL